MRLFVAVVPPPTVLDAIEAIERRDDPAVRWTTRDQWHVTLRFLGEVADVEPVIAALDGASLPAATTVELGPASTALGRAVVCVPARGLDDVAAAVIAATADSGQPPEPRAFRGHLTLARVRHGSPRRFAGAAFSARFVADRVALVQSRLRSTGAVYETVQTWPLATVGGPCGP